MTGPDAGPQPPPGPGEVSLRKPDPGVELSAVPVDTERGVPAVKRPSLTDRAARASRAVTSTRDKAAAQLTVLLVPIIRLASHALLVVALAPLLAAVLLLWAAIARGGPVVREALLLALLGAIPAVWLGIRRHQLVRAVRSPDELTADLIAVVSGRELWEGLVGNLRSGPRPVSSGRALWALRGLWRGVKAGGGVLDALTGRPTLVPLMPGRLRGLLILCLACLITAGVLLAYAALNALLAGIG